MSWQAITPYGRDFVRSTGSLQSKLTPHVLRTFDSLWHMHFSVFLLHIKLVVIKIQCRWHLNFFFFQGRQNPQRPGMEGAVSGILCWSGPLHWLLHHSQESLGWPEELPESEMSQNDGFTKRSVHSVTHPTIFWKHVGVFFHNECCPLNVLFPFPWRGSEGGRARHHWGPDWLQTP